MKAKARKSCPNCSRLQAKLNAQQAELEAQKRRLAALEATVARLEEQLAAARKNSATSSKPPSSDIVKPPRPSADSSRQIGGQPGHRKHDRVPFPPEQITDAIVHPLDVCPCCAGPLRQNAHFATVVQQVEIHQPPLSIEQHTCPEYWCDHCRRGYKAPLPGPIERGGLAGPQLT